MKLNKIMLAYVINETRLPTSIVLSPISLAPNQTIVMFVPFKIRFMIGNINETMLKTLIPVSV